ncbi:MAG: formylglycine-generating enzyme family protein [gamma proteobacterium symbiont of Bathyaustriella thionipta]|nr:formylglycine-generating enzyme family protein [gamma proteobacterium symbiont of Bathyaustriella thionipta]
MKQSKIILLIVLLSVMTASYAMSNYSALQEGAEAQTERKPDASSPAQYKSTLQEPEMVAIASGGFQMGSPAGEAGHKKDEALHVVRIKPFELAATETTVGQFRQFIQATGYQTDAEKNSGGHAGCYINQGNNQLGWQAGASWKNPGFAQTDEHPVVCVSWNDARAYAQWLAQTSGKPYRLPTESEWEYAARAGTHSRYSWGDTASHEKANYGKDACCGGMIEGADQWPYTSPVASFAPNRWHLYDMHGNTWEWVADCWNTTTPEEPFDGSARLTGDCSRHVLRGGSWSDIP